MRILHVVPSYEPQWHRGGVVRAVSELCRGLAATDHEVTVFAVEGEGVPASPVPTVLGDVRVHRFPVRIPRWWSFSPELAEACRQRIRDFDIIHITSFWHFPGIAAGKVARKHGVPYIVSPLGTFFRHALSRGRYKKHLYLRFVERANLRAAAACHYTTEMERTRSRWYGLRWPSFVAPHSIGSAHSEKLPAIKEGRRRFGLPDDALVVSFLGRLHGVKALDHFLLAFAEVAYDFDNVRLVLAGPDCGHEGLLRKLTRDLNLNERVVFPGMLEMQDKRLLFAATDLGILVSHHENFGLAAVEFMAAGVPVIVSDQVCTCPEVDKDGAGRVVSVNSQAMANVLAEMLANPSRLKRMGTAAQQSVKKRYAPKRVVQLMVTAYKDILNGHRSPECHWEH